MLFILLGFGLRVQQLGFQPLWGDEGWSFYFAVQSVPRLVALTAVDIHPPLYYLLLKAWLSLTGPGPELARFFSVLAGTLLVPVCALLGRRLFGDRAAVTAAAVTATTPMAVYYAQEVRMYGLVTLLTALSVYAFARARVPRWRVVYVVTITAALYTMYYAVFVLAFQVLYALLRPGERRSLWPRLRPFVLAGILYLPWVLYAGPRLVSYVQNKRAVEGYAALGFARYVGDHLVAFSIGHLAPLLRPYAWMALPFLVIAGLGLLAAFRARRELYLGLYLLVPLLAGFAINLAYPFTPPYYERTLLLAGPAWWLLLAAGMAWLWRRTPLLAAGTAIPMLLILAVSLTGYYTVPRYPEADYRPLLRDIAARAAPQDTLLASYQWQLGYYYAYLPAPRPRLFEVPGWGEGWAGPSRQTSRQADLAAILQESPRLWFPAHQALGHLWEDEAEETIAQLGFPALLKWYGPQTRLTLAAGTARPLVDAPTANFGDRLALEAARVGAGDYPSGRGVIPVQLRWRKLNSLGSEYRVNLRLVDAQGRTWASRDSHPQAGLAHFTDLPAGASLTDRHGLLVEAGTPPGVYRLLLSVRRVSDAHPLDVLDAQGQPQAAELHLADVTVVLPDPPVGAAALPVQVPLNADFGPAARLAGFSIADGPFRVGETAAVNLFWQALDDAPGPLLVFLELQDETGRQVGWYERPPLRPAEEWRRGDLLRDPYDLPIPGALLPGVYYLRTGLLTADRTRLPVRGQDSLPLTAITVVDRPRNFDPPAPQIPLSVEFGERARLVGLDMPLDPLQPGDPLPLTLYWQAVGPFEKNWKVFVHLLDESNRIVAQQDQIPGGGQFPTLGWRPGEYLTDGYRLQIPGFAVPGQVFRLEIGLYDPNDFSRLPVVENGQVIGDHVVLESWPVRVE